MRRTCSIAGKRCDYTVLSRAVRQTWLALASVLVLCGKRYTSLRCFPKNSEMVRADVLRCSLLPLLCEHSTEYDRKRRFCL